MRTANIISDHSALLCCPAVCSARPAFSAFSAASAHYARSAVSAFSAASAHSARSAVSAVSAFSAASAHSANTASTTRHSLSLLSPLQLSISTSSLFPFYFDFFLFSNAKIGVADIVKH